MSTKPKLDDQTQAALSAIEEALKGTAPSAEPRLPEANSDIISVRRPSPEVRKPELGINPSSASSSAGSAGSYSPPTSPALLIQRRRTVVRRGETAPLRARADGRGQ